MVLPEEGSISFPKGTVLFEYFMKIGKIVDVNIADVTCAEALLKTFTFQFHTFSSLCPPLNYHSEVVYV